MVTRRATPNAALAVAYLRASTDDQKLGPEAQRAAISEWAARQGVAVVAWHCDEGVSGSTPIDARPGLVSALASLREHGAGVLVAAKRDRLARDVMVAATLDRAVQRVGAKVRTADGMSDTAGPEGEFMRTVIDGAAQYERALIRARTKAALGAKKARGERTGTVPYGQRLSDDGVRLENHTAEQATIARARALRASGMGLAAVAEELECEGILNRKGRPFDAPAICRLLKNGGAS